MVAAMRVLLSVRGAAPQVYVPIQIIAVHRPPTVAFFVGRSRNGCKVANASYPPDFTEGHCSLSGRRMSLSPSSTAGTA